MSAKWIIRGVVVLLAWTIICPLVRAQPNRQPFRPNQPNQPLPQPNQPFKPGQPGQPNQPFPQFNQPNQPNPMFPQLNQPNQPGQPGQPGQPFPQPTMPGPVGPDPNVARTASTVFGGVLVVMIVAVLASLAFTIVWIFVAMWVAKDAQSRGMDNGTMWAILVFFLGVLGLIIYLVSRPSDSGARKPAGMRICRECGKKRSRAVKRCPYCSVA